jgi:hypothetical protein
LQNVELKNKEQVIVYHLMKKSKQAGVHTDQHGVTWNYLQLTKVNHWSKWWATATHRKKEHNMGTEASLRTTAPYNRVQHNLAYT